MTVAELLQLDEWPEWLDVETIVACARLLSTSSATKHIHLVRQLKKIKAANSPATLDAALAILKHFQISFDQTKFVKCFHGCDYSQYDWLFDIFILKSEKRPLDDWQIPHIGGSRYLTESDVVDLDKVALRLKAADAKDIDLAVGIVTGTFFMQWSCCCGKVLYVNYELDAAFFRERVRVVIATVAIKVVNKKPIWFPRLNRNICPTF
jgi:hypothetical protein